MSRRGCILITSLSSDDNSKIELENISAEYELTIPRKARVFEVLGIIFESHGQMKR